MNEDEKLKEIQDLARKRRIAFAPQDRVKDLKPWVKKVTDMMGFTRCFISDQSTISDFDLDDQELAQLNEKLGLPVSHKDYIVDVAARLREDMGETREGG